MAVIGEMLGIPEAERNALQPHVRAAVKTLELNPPLEDLDAAAAANKVLTAHLEALIAERRAARRPTTSCRSSSTWRSKVTSSATTS